MTDFEREMYQGMRSLDRCMLWIIKTAELLEYAKLLTPADQKLLRWMLEKMVREARK